MKQLLQYKCFKPSDNCFLGVFTEIAIDKFHSAANIMISCQNQQLIVISIFVIEENLALIYL